MSEKDWSSRFVYGVSFTAVTKDGFKFTPTESQPAAILQLALEPPFTGDFHVFANCGSDGSEVTHFELKSTRDQIGVAYEGQATQEELQDFSKSVIGLLEAS